MIRLFFFSIAFFLFSSSCSSNYFYVQKEKVDRNFLASTHIHTPDPRQLDPPEGDSLLIRWDFPLSIFDESLSLIAKVRFCNTEEEVVIRPMFRKRDSCRLFFPHQQILTYLVQAKNSSGDIVGQWEHQFWTEWIDIDREADKEELAQSSSASVSSQPKQASVIETP